MPSIPGFKIKQTNRATGESVEFSCICNVSTTGEFSATFPDYLVDSVRALAKTKYQDCGISSGPKNVRATGPMLARVKRLIEDATQDWLAASTKDEIVIRYRTSSYVSYCIDADGSIQPNGAYCQPGAYNKGLARWAKTELDAMHHSGSYMIGVAAVIARKSTHTRPTGEKTTYTQLRHRETEDLGEWGARLGAFIGLTPQDHGLQEVPYSEEAARFFCLLLTNLCELDRRLQSFLGDKEQVLQLIASGSNLLAGPAK